VAFTADATPAQGRPPREGRSPTAGLSSPRASGGTAASALRAVAFDLDGTLYVGSRPVEGAAAVVALVRDRGLRTLFLTNTSSVGPRRLQERLAGYGIVALVDEIYSSASVTARYLAQRGYRVAYVIGLEGLHDEVRARGLAITTRPAEAEALVVGYAPDFDAAGLPTGFRPACEFVAANLDAHFPGEGGVSLRAARETVERVATRLGRGYDFCAGKPGTYMVDCVERDLGLTPGEICVVGDSVASDVAMARAAGCRSVLIGAEGAARGADAVVRRLDELPAALDRLTGA